MTWYVIWTGLGDGPWNMAVDEWLMETAYRRPPTLRLYGWLHPTVSLGRNERWQRVVSLPRLQERGVRLVRRPTGGRAVFHYRELTYSVTAPCGGPAPLGDGLEEALLCISHALARALGRLGVRASVVRRTASAGRQEGPCFETATRYELLAGGIKVAGSAQYRTHRAFLQHGSIPLFPPVGPLRAIGPATAPSPGESDVTPLSAWRGESAHRLAFEAAQAFSEHFESPVRWGSVGAIDQAAVTRCRLRKYNLPEWTFRR